MSSPVHLQTHVLMLLDSVLSLRGRAAGFTAATPLLDHLPELDSQGAAALLAALEDHFGICLEPGSVQGEDFATVGSLVALVQRAQGV